ncbi:protein kinase, putative [Trypanosoma brucei gambiense DAL972]|uniref:Protein kinase, putative n=3 Tax=Trypanosoma brucei TaxID=5691 RepID=Q385I2_TRYB2|nr:protein kinase, putative [Trypanosoma brucei gambiense DAL972]XP_828661.1 protein kinase, putative [Trypanosoma brucei brucei TREU927]EAN79549.1 protein kinase, putative [Trypanosoma brucei brucei TREU927]RHW67063.1 protein kinase [Trypanosoma brucei equiperdum]CBH17544.1 protein kinase, putative [Trypanosoma brucei gambiense DAL972]|eukprot:XP_011779808.1 protein kinase, putative [Trypanosoma brucei gambiense DAL972]
MCGKDSSHDYSTLVTALSRTMVFKQDSHPRYEGPVALKVAAKSGSDDRGMHPSLHEAGVYKLICPHPSIPDYVDCVEDWFDTERFLAEEERRGEQRLPVLVTQFIKAVALDRFLCSVRVIRWSVVIHIANQLVEVLKHINSKGVVYRDLKLPNVIIGAGGNVWLVDYASSMIVGGEEPSSGVTSHMRPPESFEFPDHQSGEQISQAQLSFMADFWVFGAFLLEILSGRPYLGSFDVRSSHLTQSQLEEKVLEGVSVIKDRYKGAYYNRRFNKSFPCNAKTLWDALTGLLIKLLRRNPKERLGHDGGWYAVKQQPFFKYTLCDLTVPFPLDYEDEIEELMAGF